MHPEARKPSFAEGIHAGYRSWILTIHNSGKDRNKRISLYILVPGSGAWIARSCRREPMANEQHLKRLIEAIEKHDISIWNRWRQENPVVRPDLSGSDLRRADLKHAAFDGALFRDANLRGTDFSYADLHGSDLNKANLIRTHFNAANLAEADFSEADLSEANLSEANLSEANFSHSFILGALFLGADLYRANLENDVKSLTMSQVKKAKNWETAFFGRGILEVLGLPVDHNEALRKKNVGMQTKG
ncbi:MAG: pentapeptide repeat-containing protein [Anaerolineales bacterium]|nr:pentapeptide repeat-containing protein [Anaerolineales bacterium]